MSENVQNVQKIDFLRLLPNDSYNLYFNNTTNLTINGKKFNSSVLTKENDLTKENEESGHIVYCDNGVNGVINYILFTTGVSKFVFHFETGVSLDKSKEYSFQFSTDNGKTILIIISNHNNVIVIEINEQLFFEYNDYYYYIAAGNCLSKNENKQYYNNRGEGACLFDAFAQIFFPIDYDNVNNKININFNEYNNVKKTSLELRKIVADIHTGFLINFDSYKNDENGPNSKYYKNISDNIKYYYSIEIDSKIGKDGETYIQNINKDFTWGEDYEIKILSKYFDLNCNIINYNDKNEPMINHPLNENYNKMYPFLYNDDNTYAYPYIFCNIGNNHWELKKHYCALDFDKENKIAKKRFKELKDGIYEDNKKKTSNDETQEIANIIKAIDVFINSGSSSSKPVDYSDEIVGVVGAIDGSSSSSSSTSITNDYSDEVVGVVGAVDGSNSSGSSSGSSTSTTNDYSDEVVSVVGALEQSSSSGSSTGTTASSSSSSVTSTTFIVPKEKTNLKDFFMKTSYIIKKGDKKYLFAEIINTPPVPTLSTIVPSYKEIYKNHEITITEFWQNKLIDTDQIGYIIEDGAEKYGVVPDFDTKNI